MSDDPSAAVIHDLAVRELLNVPKLYGPHGFINILNSGNTAYAGNDGPPTALVAALEQLETATVDPTLLTGGQTVASVEAQTISDLQEIAFLTRQLLGLTVVPTLLTPGTYISAESFVRGYNFNSLPADAKLFTPAAAKLPVTVIDPSPPPASGAEQYLVTNLSTGVSDWENGQAYDGPVAALRNQFISVAADNVNVTATEPNNFIRTGSGNDGIDISHLAVSGGGTNVVDGGAGSNFVLLYDPGYGKGANTVLTDARADVADTWSTLVNFRQGDAVTIYGVTPSATTLDWEDNQGAAGFTGLTLHVTEQGRPTVSLTLAGYANYTSADLRNGRLGVSFGNDPASGSSYLNIQGTAS
jgi:hypothetical protein